MQKSLIFPLSLDPDEFIDFLPSLLDVCSSAVSSAKQIYIFEHS